MSNDYANNQILSKHACELMRRINALELLEISSGSETDLNVYGTGNGLFTGITGIDCLEQNLYISDVTQKQIQVLQEDGTYVRKWGSSGTGDGQFTYPNAVRIFNDEVYVSDFNACRFQVFSLLGVFSRKFGSYGTGDGQFQTGLVDFSIYDNEVYGIDSGTNRYILVFTTAGVFQRKFSVGSSGQNYSICGFNNEIFVGNYNSPTTTIFVVSKTGSAIRSFTVPCGSGATVSSMMERNGVLFFICDNYLFIYTPNGTQLFSSYILSYPNYELCVNELATKVFVTMRGTGVNKVRIFQLNTDQTEFHAYRLWPYEESITLGAPDGGILIPDDNALVDPWGEGGVTGRQWTVARIITDMRNAIQAIVTRGVFKNPSTGIAYNWTDGSANNLYFVAMGDRTKYGALSGARYTWTRTELQMAGTRMLDIDIGEIAECITTLENANA